MPSTRSPFRPGAFLALATVILGACESAPDARHDGGQPAPFTERLCGVTGEGIDVHRPEDIVALAGCTGLRGSLRFGDTQLANVDGLEELRTVAGTINFFRNPKLLNVAGLRNLESVGDDFFIHNNPVLADVKGLANLRAVGGELAIHSDLVLETLAGLERLESVGALNVSGNPELRSLEGLTKLTVIRGDLSIKDNPSLSQAQAQAFATSRSVGGMTEVSGNGI
jgi:hypothetical protein